MPVTNDEGQNEARQALFETLFESSADAILTLDDEIILDCNHTAEIIFGQPQDAINGKSVLALSPERQPDGRLSAEALRGLFTAARAGEPQFFEWTQLRGDGTPFPVEISLNRVEVHKKTYFQESIRDITLRKLDEAELMDTYKRISAAEEELRRQYKALAETEEMFRNPVEHSPVGVYLRQDGIIRYANPMFADMFGYAREEVINKLFADTVNPSGKSDTCAPNDQKVADPAVSGSRRFEFAGRKKDGTAIDLEIFEAPMEYKGHPAHYGSIVDITLRKRAEATVRGLLNATRDQTVLTDNDGKILAANEAFAASAKKPVHELVGTIIYELIRTGGISMKTADAMQNKGTGTISFEEQLGDRWFDTTLYSINNAEGAREQVAVFRHDITSSKSAERDLLAANEQLVAEKERLSLFAAALDNMRDCAIITKSMGQILYVNATFEKRFGYKAADVLEKKLKDLAHPENQFGVGDNFFFDYRDTDRQGLFLGANAYGVKIPLMISGKPILYYNKKPTHFVFVLREKMG